MKKYKVGDTVYVKGTMKPVDDVSLPYCVDFGNGNTGWIPGDDIIDELPAESVKPVLPKEVGEELDIAKNELPFDTYIGNVVYSVSGVKASYLYYLDNTNAIIKLADAWRYGYTVAKEKRYLVGLDGLVTTDGAKQYLTSKDGKWFASRIQPSLHQAFTDEELKLAPIWTQQLNREEVTDDDD